MVLVNQGSVQACVCSEVCWLLIWSNPPPIDQSSSASFKKHLKGPGCGSCWGASSQCWHPPCWGCRASPDTAPRAAQSPWQGHRAGTAHAPCLTLGQGRSQLNPRALKVSYQALGLSYTLSCPALSNSSVTELCCSH